jgi:hypothetical protein
MEVIFMSKIQSEFKPVVFPVDILNDENLDIYEQSVMIVLYSYTNAHKAQAFPSTKTICKQAKIGKTKCFEVLNSLEEKGYMVRENRPAYTKNKKIVKDSNMYTLIHKPVEKVVRNTDQGGSSPHEHGSPHELGGSSQDGQGVVRHTDSNISISSFSISSISSSSIDSKLKEEFPNTPFEEIKEALLKDKKVIIETEKQYEAMLRYRLGKWKPKATRKSKPIRKEVLPDWFDPKQQVVQEQQQEDIDIEQLRKELEEFKRQ